jgi:rsbT antagonist protein RsbS
MLKVQPDQADRAPGRRQERPSAPGFLAVPGEERAPAMKRKDEQELPIIQIRGCLLVSIQSELHDRLALELQTSLMERVRALGIKGVILDVSWVEVIDSYITRILNDIGKSVRFMGADCYIVGIRPAVAMTLVEMGVELDAVSTALNLDAALEKLERLQ